MTMASYLEKNPPAATVEQWAVTADESTRQSSHGRRSIALPGPAVTLGQEGQSLFSVLVDGEEVGFGGVEADASALALMGTGMVRSSTASARVTFRLSPPHRGRGLGEAVLCAVLDRGFQCGYARLWLGLVDGRRHTAAHYVAVKVGMRRVQPIGLPEHCIVLEIRRSSWSPES
jgi:GNAT superfamily N-acetyltransferase